MAPVTIDNHGIPLLIFEPEAQYHQHNAIVGYWGPVQSSIDWCEYNYILSFYVAEMFNTVSNLGLACMGLFGAYMAWRNGLGARFVGCHLGTAMVGVGSAAFHGTLTHVGQQGDETPMIIGAAVWLWSLAFQDPAFESKHPTLQLHSRWVVTVLVGAFAVLHYVMRFTVGFQVVVGLMILSGIWQVGREYPFCRDAAALRVGRLYYNLSGWSALVLWLCDQHFCVALHALPGGLSNPQFHAWWHVLMAINCYCGPTFLAYQRQVRLGRKPAMRFALGIVPYVHVAAPNVATRTQSKTR